MTRYYEHGNEFSDFVKGGGFLEYLSYCKLLKCDCARTVAILPAVRICSINKSFFYSPTIY